MNNQKIGNLLSFLRKEKNLTQKEVANCLNVSDKTVSKWERGLGFPDISFLPELSRLFGVNIDQLLSGKLDSTIYNGGNMRNLKFYLCPECQNVITSTSQTNLSCCGRQLTPLTVNETSANHQLKTSLYDQEYFLTSDHQMTKDHYISFIAYVSFDRYLLIKLFPEQNLEVYLPLMNKGTLYAYCSQHGLWKQPL